MTEGAPILRLRAMVADSDDPKGRYALIVASDRIARFIADPEAVEKIARAIDPAFFSPVSGPVVWTDELIAAARAQASATARGVLNLLAAVGVEHG